MTRTSRDRALFKWILAVVLMTPPAGMLADGPTITPSVYWKNAIQFPYDAFCARGIAKESPKWIKFAILLPPYDPNIVYFQDSRKYVYHYSFAAEALDPFGGMTPEQFNEVTLFRENQQAILGTVILPGAVVWPTEPLFSEYGIQFVRQDTFTPEEIRDLFHRVTAAVAAPPDVQAFYFPTYEQQAAAAASRSWLESQGVPVSSAGRWATGNTCYSEGWALGTLKFFPGDEIADAYHNGSLAPGDILLTDGVPAEVPFIAGIISLAASTPNSHVAILARTYAVPFAHLALAGDAQRAQELVGRRVLFSAYVDEYGTDVRLIDTDGVVDEEAVTRILQLRQPTPLSIQPMASLGVFGLSTEGLSPSDIRYVGGKGANFGILRAAVPDNSPRALSLTFDLWKAFLSQPLAPSPAITLAPGEHILFWADGDTNQGPTHTNFRLDKGGEFIGLCGPDGVGWIDSIRFGRQETDVSFGRVPDGGDLWQPMGTATPGTANVPGDVQSGIGVVINELMADNEKTIRDPDEQGEYPDWIELYNASDETVSLSGMYLTDNVNEPTQWQIPLEVSGPTLGQEISRRLSKYDSYPPADMQMLSQELASIRRLLTQEDATTFSSELKAEVIAVLTDPQHGLDPAVPVRFRSSTNVEDSMDFIGAGLYDSYSGCLADAMDSDEDGPCACDPGRKSERDIFDAIRQVFAGFYNDNAFLERLRHGVHETDVGMAIVAHHSFPDELELANGVATVDKRNDEITISLVTQLGAVSVTNPQDDSVPEEVTVLVLPSGSMVPARLTCASSLVRMGETVMAWKDDYMELADLLLRVTGEFERTAGKSEYTLDIEYKKVAPGGRVLPAGGLVIKQVRQVPLPNDTQTAFLVNQPTEFEVYTGEVVFQETTDVFADHRLKSRWRIETRSTTLEANALQECLYTHVEIEYLDDDEIRTISGRLSELPSAAHGVQAYETIDSWQITDILNPRTYHLRTQDLPIALEASVCPAFIPSDLGRPGYGVPYRFLHLTVEYAGAVEKWDPAGRTFTTTNQVYLWPRQAPSEEDIPQERALTAGGITITSRFYYPPLPREITDWELAGGNTGPLKRWEQTTVTGLTAEPIVLKGYYSQTFRPEHHNQREHLLFEPRLEPGISPDILSELKGKNIRFIHMILDKDEVGPDESRIVTCGD